MGMKGAKASRHKVHSLATRVDLSRRDFIKQSALLVGVSAMPLGILSLPSRRAHAQTLTTFDYYISPTGTDSNPGTLASPWAITSLQVSNTNWSKLAGKRIGLLPGTYNVGSMMENDASTGALQIPGGSSSSWTYLASADASGNYSPRTATLNAFANGLYGGFHSTGPGVYDGPILSHVGRWPKPYPLGYLTLDGIVFTGFSYKGIRIGGASSGDGPVITGPVTVQNCEFTGQGFNTGDGQDNGNSIWVDPFQPPIGQQGCLVTNCWFHDNVWEGGATSADHLNAIIAFGFTTECYGLEFCYNTVVKSGSIYGKEGGISGVNVHHNYIDATAYAVYSGCIADFMSGGGTFNGLTHPSSFHHNVCLSSGSGAGSSGGMMFPTLRQTAYGSGYGWQTPVTIYNNTVVCVGANTGAMVFDAACAQDNSGLGQLRAFNNIYASNAGGSWNNYGNFLTTVKSPAVWDYNLFPSSGVTWAIVPDANNFSLCTSHSLYTSAASFASAVAVGGGIAGIEAHSVAAAPKFTNTGSYAELYKLASGSAGVGQGSSDGTPSGTPCDLGAWGNGATQIGCNFTSGAQTINTPMPPTLLKVA